MRGHTQIEVHPAPVEEQLLSGSFTEVQKWGNIVNSLRGRENVLGSRTQKDRIALFGRDKPSTITEGMHKELSRIDRDFFTNMSGKLWDVLYGKGVSRETGHYDTAGIAYSELLAWDELGLLRFPDYDFSRTDLERAYEAAFVKTDQEMPDISHIEDRELRQVILDSEIASKKLADYHMMKCISWKRLHNLPVVRRAAAKAEHGYKNAVSVWEHEKESAVGDGD